MNISSLFGHGGAMTGALMTPFSKPILMSKCPRLAEFTDRIDCMKFDEGNISKTVMELYNDVDLQKKISIGALKIAENFSAEKSAKKLVEFYQNCLNQ